MDQDQQVTIRQGQTFVSHQLEGFTIRFMKERHNEVLQLVLQIAEVAGYAVFAEVFYDNSVDVAYLVETILLDVL